MAVMRSRTSATLAGAVMVSDISGYLSIGVIGRRFRRRQGEQWWNGGGVDGRARVGAETEVRTRS